MGVVRNGRVRFWDYEFDSNTGKLLRDGRPVKIQPQPLRVLGILLERPGQIVSRDELRERIWGDSTYVEFDQGLNFCIRQVRRALRENASRPSYIETLPKQGYRWIAPVSSADAAEPEVVPPAPAPEAPVPRIPHSRSRRRFYLTAAAAILAVAIASVYSLFRARPARVQYTQITDFTDSASVPTLSPDGRMLAFIHGSSKDYLTSDQIWIKLLPTGEAKHLTDDPRMKYSLAFSPDSSRIAYTVLADSKWTTYTVPVLGGDAEKFLENAAGLTWLDAGHLLFSEIRTGLHMGVVTATPARANLRDLYFPPHERGMAHYAYASPDRQSALVVEMDGTGGWAPCRLISLRVVGSAATVGPAGPCRSAGWSPDGWWMYFTAQVSGQSHIWRQRFPNGRPEQLTFGPTEEEGIAVDPDGRSLITSLGIHQSSIGVREGDSERILPSEGEIITGVNMPALFRPDGRTLYYLLRAAGSESVELRRINLGSGRSEAVLPRVSVASFDISPDGAEVVYQTKGPGGTSEIWLSPLNRETPPRRIGESGEDLPKFGPNGEILFRFSEGSRSYLGRAKPDGSGRSKVFPFPIDQLRSVSPEKRWVAAAMKRNDGETEGDFAVPLDGGPRLLLCTSFCWPTWSPDGKYLYIPLQPESSRSPGKSLAIPLGPGESIPAIPPEGIGPHTTPETIPGSRIVDRAELAPGLDPAHYAFVETTIHRNLYRITLP